MSPQIQTGVGSDSRAYRAVKNRVSNKVVTQSLYLTDAPYSLKSDGTFRNSEAIFQRSYWSVSGDFIPIERSSQT